MDFRSGKPVGGSVVQGGAKLLKIDLQTDSIIQTIFFDDEIAPSPELFKRYKSRYRRCILHT